MYFMGALLGARLATSPSGPSSMDVSRRCRRRDDTMTKPIGARARCRAARELNGPYAREKQPGNEGRPMTAVVTQHPRPVEGMPMGRTIVSLTLCAAIATLLGCEKNETKPTEP